MANITVPSDSDTFAGDEFSNNLFSDLAPLLTLFGEQVTKQFLSMRYRWSFANVMMCSMGWADNILLAMGPLGIMTIIVSAIRVGRVKKLKAMVGRARESQSTAEQELLSSTSNNVCELWSGYEIVRVMGQPAGMKSLVIWGGKVYDIKTAVDEHVMMDPSIRWRPNRYGNSALLSRLCTYLVEDDPEALDADYLNLLRNAAPNLALNVRDATAPAWELWTCAIVGVALQMIAAIIPGIATYHWKWTKAGVEVPGYGYPCFLIGTLLVVLGTMACGHVIEGVTTEHTFQAAEGKDVQILQLQRACTVSDQNFSSCAIFNNKDNHSIRTSRLNGDDYSTLAAVSSLLAVVGFIVQFVGLRALHWSATIIQLGITLVMTGVRAWVRRGLASDPTTRATLEGHEVAWLTLYILSHQQDVDNTIPPPMSQSSANGVEQSHNAAPASTTISQHTDISYPGILHHRDNYHEFWDALTDVQLRNGDELIWELIMGYDAIRDQAVRPMQLQNDVVISKLSEVAGINPSDLFAFKQLCAPIDLETPLRVQLADKLDAGDEDALKVYAQIASIIPIDMEVSFAATAFISVVERVMKIFCNCRAVVWKSDGIQIAQHDPDIKPAARVGVDSLAWGFPVSARNISCSKTKTKQLFLKIRRPHEFSSLYDEADPDRWCLLEKDSIFGLISLWSYAVARKQSAIEKMNASLSRSSSPEIRNDLGGRGFGRIVGTSEQSILEDWLGMPASQVSFPDGTNTISKEDAFGRYHTKSPTWFLGMLLSPMADAQLHPESDVQDLELARDDVLVVQTGDDSKVVLKFAQELFSLFVLAIATNVHQVLGRTTFDGRKRDMSREMSRPTRSWENSVFSEIANEVVSGGLAHDITEAYSLIIPAFSRCGNLPEETGFDDLPTPTTDE